MTEVFKNRVSRWSQRTDILKTKSKVSSLQMKEFATKVEDLVLMPYQHIQRFLPIRCTRFAASKRCNGASSLYTFILLTVFEREAHTTWFYFNLSSLHEAKLVFRYLNSLLSSRGQESGFLKLHQKAFSRSPTPCVLRRFRWLRSWLL